jgi:hypothetical protein
MDNARLAQLALALGQERETMKRQDLLRQMWRLCRGTQEVSSGAGQLNTTMAAQRKNVKLRTSSLSPAQGGSELHAASASMAI